MSCFVSNSRQNAANGTVPKSLPQNSGNYEKKGSFRWFTTEKASILNRLSEQNKELIKQSEGCICSPRRFLLKMKIQKLSLLVPIHRSHTLVGVVSPFCVFFCCGEQCRCFFREGFLQGVVTYFSVDECLELAPVRLFGV